jgi:hypothetical protein
VFNRAGLARAMTLGGFAVDSRTPVLRDRPGPAVLPGGLSVRTRASHALGILGRSAAVRGTVR